MTLARRAEMAKVAQHIESALPGAVFTGDSHALLMAIYKDPTNEMALRLDAAKAAIGYEKPRLSAVDMDAKVDLGQEDRLSLLERRANGSANAIHQ